MQFILTGISMLPLRANADFKSAESGWLAKGSHHYSVSFLVVYSMARIMPKETTWKKDTGE